MMQYPPLRKDISSWQQTRKQEARAVRGKTRGAAGGYVPNFAGGGSAAALAKRRGAGAAGAAQLKIPTQRGLTVLVKGIEL